MLRIIEDEDMITEDRNVMRAEKKGTKKGRPRKTLEEHSEKELETEESIETPGKYLYAEPVMCNQTLRLQLKNYICR